MDGDNVDVVCRAVVRKRDVERPVLFYESHHKALGERAGTRALLDYIAFKDNTHLLFSTAEVEQLRWHSL